MPPAPTTDMRFLTAAQRGTRIWSIYRHSTAQWCWVDLVALDDGSLRVLRLRKSENVYAWPEGKHGFFKVPMEHTPGATVVRSIGVHLHGDKEWFCHGIL